MSELLSARKILTSASSRSSIAIKLQSLLLSFLLLNVSVVSAASVPATFSVPNGGDRFQHLVVDKETGLVYVGGVNRLYQLSPDLDLQVTVETGPREDSPECPAIGCSDSVVKRLTDNVNKALVIDYRNTMSLITCGTLYQGSCSVRNLKNISEELMDVREPVVANNSTATTVVFIGPVPYWLSSQSSVLSSNSDVLYVGATYTGNSPYRSDVPAVSSRSLARHKMFQIANTDRREGDTRVTTGTRISVDPSSRNRSPIHYVYGFSSEGFSYFLTTQMKESTTNNSSYISKLVRVCQRDPDFHSYTEVPLECGDEDGTQYNLVQAAYVGKPGSSLAAKLDITIQDDVLYAVFAQSESAEGGEMSNRPVARSALCVYTLKSIRRKFVDNIKRCFNGVGVTGLDFISPSRRCVRDKWATIGEDFCGLDVNTPLGGDEPVFETAVFTRKKVLLTAVVAPSIGNSTVVFVGTSTGRLIKMVLTHFDDRGCPGWRKGSAGCKGSIFEYDDITVDEGKAVSSDLVFDAQRMHLYTMTENKVTKVRVQDCETYNTKCGKCIIDPFCGWCRLENKCSLESDCQDADKGPLYWNSYNVTRCDSVIFVAPSQMQRTTVGTLSLVNDKLPTLSGQLQCAFSAFGQTLLTNATRTANGVSCTTPRTEDLPANPIGQHHFNVELSVRTTSGPTDFEAIYFTFFDCNTHNSCSECVSSPFPCDWCVNGHRCTHDTAENCRNETSVTGISRIRPSIRSGPRFCPRINVTDSVSTEILVSHGDKKSIKVKVENIAQFVAQTNFVCQFNIEGKVMNVPAQLLGDIIECDDTEFTYSSQTPNTTATFSVLWNGSKPLYNPRNIHVIIYDCSKMADNCGLCHALSEKYQCGWCQTSGKCEVREHCNPLLATGGVWLDRDEICPDIQVKSFYPRLGPWEGGTNVTIEGVNLGKKFSDIAGGIEVAGITCRPYEELYVQSRVVCLVDGLKTNESRRGPVIVRVSSYKAESADNYEFVDPMIESIYPTWGPLSGGTQLTIRGQFLNAGRFIRASINGYDCEITNINKTHTICRTGASDGLRSGELSMWFDSRVRHFNQKKYEYVPDPIIESVGGIRQGGVPRGIPSGGITVSVSGNNFKNIQEPKMVVYWNETQFSGICNVKSNQQMECRSPIIPVDDQLISPDEPLLLDYGFLMDGVSSLLNLPLLRKFPKFRLYPDPVLTKFNPQVKDNIPVIIGATGGSAVVVAIVLGIAFFYFRKMKKKTMEEREEQMKRLNEARHDVFPQARRLLEGNRRGINPLLPLEDQTECLPYDVRWEFPSHRLKFGKELGTGYFGRVVKAEAVGIKDAEEFVKTVAVKMVRSQTNFGALQALASELKIMIHLGSHLNVLNLLGACTINITKGELLVIVEFCRFGCLRSYLVKNRKSFVNQIADDLEDARTDDNYLVPYHLKLKGNPVESGSNNIMGRFLLTDTNSADASSKYSKLRSTDDINDHILDPEPLWQYKQNDDKAPVSFSTQDLISWSFQIARGMNYLASKKVFHGDLAARNILLADSGVVKVADFGMARKMYYEDDYKKSGQGPMPIRWMAIESLTDKIFSSQSDVWSFGVLLWELFSLGKVPYPGMNSKSFVEELENGYRLQKPEYAPNSFGDIMSSCWKKDPKDRPTFSELEETISREMEEYVGTYYCNLNETYEDSNQKKETASSTEVFGLAKFLTPESKLEKSTSVSLSDKGNRKLATFSRIFLKSEKRESFQEVRL